MRPDLGICPLSFWPALVFSGGLLLAIPQNVHASSPGSPQSGSPQYGNRAEKSAETGPNSAAIRSAPAFSRRRVATPDAGNWITNGGTVFNQRYSPSTRITPANVKDLKGVWRVHLGSGSAPKYSGEAQPLVYRGVVYIVTGADDVFAVDVKSGRVLWSYLANLSPDITSVCCGWTSRGLALGDGKIFVGQLDNRVIALDQKSGKTVWSTQTERWEDGFSITGAPVYYDGLVIFGFAGGDKGARCRVEALDARTGREVWRFYTVPGPGEFGHDTWPRDSDVWKRGGNAVWQTPAIDPLLGLLYFSTGNPAPDFNGGVREGDNLFSSSIVALDVKTGKYRWHYQQVHHDIWDYDSPNPVVLFDLPIQGRTRKAVAQAAKTGWVYILDRTSGKPLLGIDETPVPQDPRQKTSKTQPIPRGDAFVPQKIDKPQEGALLVNEGQIFTPFWTEPQLGRPATIGGANWPPSSYNPKTRYLYVCAQDRIQLFTGGGEGDLGGRFVTAKEQPELRGRFSAISMETNKIVWEQKWKDPCYSGSVTTGAGLVFVGQNDGNLMAYDARDGHLLWQFQTGAGVNAPASVFEMDGEAYVVVLSAGNLFGNAPRGDSLWLFSLKGTLGPADPASTRVNVPASSADQKKETDLPVP